MLDFLQYFLQQFLQYFLSALIVLEMLGINLYISHICFHRKRSPAVVVPVMIVVTLFLMGVSVVTIEVLPGYGEGRFIYWGFFYVIPLKVLYRNSVKTTVSVMCLAWSYTMLAFLFSKYLAQLLPAAGQLQATLVIQTVVYLLTLRSFLRLLHEKLLCVITYTASDKKNNMLLCLSCSTASLAFCANWVLWEDALAAKLALICMLAGNTVIVFHALYSLAQARQHVVQTQLESLTDPLTGLNNRKAFLERSELLIDGGHPFSIFFLDLDRFKSINDTYGHMTGDWYLRQFAREFCRQLSAEGTLYRIAGDEFVFLCEKELCTDAVLTKIRGLSFHFPDSDLSFLGFSCGAAAFPADAGTLDELLAAADRRMYQDKADRYAATTTV